MKLLMIVPTLSLRLGGSVTSVCELARLLARDHEVDIWTSTHELESHDISLHDLCCVRMFPLLTRQFFYLAPGMLPATVFNARDYDAVNVFHFWTMTGVVGRLLRVRSSAPVFIHTQGIFLPVAMSHHRIRKRLAQVAGGVRLINGYTAAIACNSAELPGIREWGFKGPIHVLPNATTAVAGARGVMRQRCSLGADEQVVAYLNRFDPIKRVKELCQAFRMIQARRENVVFLLAGDAGGQYGREVQEYAREVGLRARFLGFLGPAEKWSLLADADVICQYSAQEGLSNALLEAIAAGVPVVASRGCHFDEVEQTGAGLVVDSVEQMADATLKILSNPGLRSRMVRNAVGLSMRYTPDVVAATFTDIVAHAGPAALHSK